MVHHRLVFVFAGTALLLFCAIPLAWSRIIYVPGTRPTIQAGIVLASDGDTVLVAPGRYYDNIIFRGKKIVLTSRFYESGDTSYIFSTIIDGRKPTSADSASVVRITNGEDSTTILQGFTITGGSGTNWTDEHGAGIYREGGGILVASSSPTIRWNIITKNAVVKNAGVISAGGGGIRAGDGHPHIFWNTITENTGRYGAGVVLNYTGVTMRNNILTGNAGGQDYGGGALWINADGPSSKLIQNNTIAANSVIAVYVYQGSSTFRDNIFWGSSAASPAQFVVKTGSPYVSYCDVQGGYSGEGNINVDPAFSGAGFHLSTGSPCIDAGDTSLESRDREDPMTSGSALWPSMGTLRNDIGAFGGPAAMALPDMNVATGVGASGSLLPAGMNLEQNYPNPFNPTTTIWITIGGVVAPSGVYPEQSRGVEGPASYNVRLVVYDLLGREVATLANGQYPAGRHSFTFNARGFASGVYFCRLTAGAYAATRQMILLK